MRVEQLDPMSFRDNLFSIFFFLKSGRRHSSGEFRGSNSLRSSLAALERRQRHLLRDNGQSRRRVESQNTQRASQVSVAQKRRRAERVACRSQMRQAERQFLRLQRKIDHRQ